MKGEIIHEEHYYVEAEKEFFGPGKNSELPLMRPIRLPEGYTLTTFGNVIPPKGTANRLMKKYSSGPGLCLECRCPLSGS